MKTIIVTFTRQFFKGENQSKTNLHIQYKRMITYIPTNKPNNDTRHVIPLYTLLNTPNPVSPAHPPQHSLLLSLHPPLYLLSLQPPSRTPTSPSSPPHSSLTTHTTTMSAQNFAEFQQQQLSQGMTHQFPIDSEPAGANSS